MSAPGSSDNRAWLRLERASLRLGGRLFLREIDWSAGAAEQWALIGANGSGKTVLAELALSLRQPAGGVAWLDPAIEPLRDIGWVSFEAQRRLCEDDARHDISDYLENAVDSGTTVGALLAHCGGEAERARVIARLGIGALLERGIRFLSSGEARRTLLAQLLLQRPRVAVLDNPFEGIDAASRQAIGLAIDELLASSTRVLLLTRHAAGIPHGITHVLRLEDGRVLDRGERTPVLAHVACVTGASTGVAPEPPLPITHVESPSAGVAPLLELRAVSARYGEQLVLDRVDLRLERGEHLCIAGPNGCGKSTLLSLICGDNPRAYGQQLRVLGRLRGDGEPVWELKRHFGIVSNALHLGYPSRTRVIDVLLSGFHDTLGLYQECAALERSSARAWLAALGLSAQADARFGTLSFGEQRMLLIARAVVKAPPLLILDEPCSGLDGSNRERALALIDRIAAAGRTQILFVSHEADEMPRCITRRLEFRRDVVDGPYALVEV